MLDGYTVDAHFVPSVTSRVKFGINMTEKFHYQFSTWEEDLGHLLVLCAVYIGHYGYPVDRLTCFFKSWTITRGPW